MSNISDWIKRNRVDVAFWLGLIIIVSLSFGLGYLVASQSSPAPIVIEKNSQ
ncbi:MAG: hypothetical protein ABSF47_03535 [Minisyncoccia bacterium]|jgi:hypothetical protein